MSNLSIRIEEQFWTNRLCRANLKNQLMQFRKKMTRKNCNFRSKFEQSIIFLVQNSANLTRSLKNSYKNVLQELPRQLTRYLVVTSCQDSSKILKDLTRLTNSLVPGCDADVHGFLSFFLEVLSCLEDVRNVSLWYSRRHLHQRAAALLGRGDVFRVDQTQQLPVRSRCLFQRDLLPAAAFRGSRLPLKLWKRWLLQQLPSLQRQWVTLLSFLRAFSVIVLSLYYKTNLFFFWRPISVRDFVHDFTLLVEMIGICHFLITAFFAWFLTSSHFSLKE